MEAEWEQDLRKFLSDFENIDFKAAFAVADRVISEGFEENFYNQQDDEGNLWKPRKDDLPHPLLIKTGKMFRAATNPGDAGHLYRDEGGTLVVGVLGNVVPYAIYHHTGTRKMPARRVIYANKTTQQRLFDEFSEAADRAMGF